MVIVALVAVVPSAGAGVSTVNDVENVHLSDRNRFVSDGEGYLSQAARSEADARLRALMDSTTVEVAVVLVGSIGDADIYDFTNSLARQWGVGKADKNNGVVVLFAMEQHQVRIHVGSGAEGVLPDLAAKRIIDETIIPAMRSDNVDGAVTGAVERLCRVFTDPSAAAELRSSVANDSAPLNGETLFGIFMVLAVMVGVCSLALLAWKLWNMRSLSDYRKALYCRQEYWLFVVLAVLSLGLGLIALLVMLWLKRYYRNKPRKCDVCGTMMQKLNEEDDNKYLTPAQDLEERVKSVDYDVWLCPKCGATEVFPFVSRNSRYVECDVCRTRAMTLLYDCVERRATVRTEGVGVKVYECKNCKHQLRKRYSIAKEAPVVIIGGGGGRGGGGGGFSGGSWGGGGFSGGGAGGSW